MLNIYLATLHSSSNKTHACRAKASQIQNDLNFVARWRSCYYLWISTIESFLSMILSRFLILNTWNRWYILANSHNRRICNYCCDSLLANIANLSISPQPNEPIQCVQKRIDLCNLDLRFHQEHAWPRNSNKFALEKTLKALYIRLDKRSWDYWISHLMWLYPKIFRYFMSSILLCSIPIPIISCGLQFGRRYCIWKRSCRTVVYSRHVRASTCSLKRGIQTHYALLVKSHAQCMQTFTFHRSYLMQRHHRQKHHYEFRRVTLICHTLHAAQ